MTPSIMLQLPGLVARMPRGSQGRSRGYEHSPGLPMFQIPLLCHSREQIRLGKKRQYFLAVMTHTPFGIGYEVRTCMSSFYENNGKQSGTVFSLLISRENFRAQSSKKLISLKKRSDNVRSLSIITLPVLNLKSFMIYAK